MQQTIRGRFNEIIGGEPIQWDDDAPVKKPYFTLPTDPAPAAPPPEPEHERLARQMAEAVARSKAAVQAAKQPRTGPYFVIPSN